MAVNATRQVSIVFTGDFAANNTFSAGANADSPCERDVINLAVGNNTINVPGGNKTPRALTIIPPAGNASLITLKGVAGDTGVPLHKTDPTSIGLDTTFASLVLNNGGGATINSVVLIWT